MDVTTPEQVRIFCVFSLADSMASYIPVGPYRGGGWRMCCDGP